VAANSPTTQHFRQKSGENVHVKHAIGRQRAHGTFFCKKVMEKMRHPYTWRPTRPRNRVFFAKNPENSRKLAKNGRFWQK
jgi:hypothetical protein